MTVAYVGIGSNLDQPRERVNRAFTELAKLPQTRLARRSSLYLSAPIGHADQPEFVNAVAELETGLSADALLAQLLALEAGHGRRRSFPNAPRTLDLDLLLYGDSVINQPGLIVPHPRMHQRAFVLGPLLEIAPQASIPGLGPAAVRLHACSGQKVERMT